MRKGITPIIAIIVLLLITVSIAGMAWSFISGFVAPLTQQTLTFVDGSCRNGIAKIILLNAGTAQISMNTTEVTHNEPYTADADTVLLLHFDDVSGTSARDRSSVRNTATLVHTPNLVKGRFGNALNFSKSTTILPNMERAVRVDDNSNLDWVSGQGLTVEVWIKTDYVVGIFGPLINKTHVAGSVKGYYLNLNHENGKISFTTSTQAVLGISFIESSSSRKYTDNKWHHVAGVFSESPNKISLWIDGIFEGSDSTSIQSPEASGTDMGIAGPFNPAAFKYYTGLLDEVRISKVARDFTKKQQGWNYYCKNGIDGDSMRCGDLTVTKVSGRGTFIPGFNKNSVDKQETLTFIDGGCKGTCSYKITTLSGTLDAGATC